jgi:linoleoyl-CoA desaturase
MTIALLAYYCLLVKINYPNEYRMQVIKFIGSSEQEKQFFRTLRKNINQYFKDNNISTKANFYMVVKTIIMLCIYIVPVLLILVYSPNFVFGLLLFMLTGVGKAGIGMSVMHDGLHGAYSSKKWVNKLAGFTMYLIGSNVFNWKIQHNIYHHAYTNIDGLDEDIQTRWIIRLSEHTPLKSIHRFQHIYALFLYSLMTFSMLIGDITQLIGYNKSGITAKHLGKPSIELFIALFVKFVYLLIMIGFPIIFTSYVWWQVLTGFVVMHLVAGFVFSIVFQMAHIVEGAEQPVTNEHGITDNEWAIHQLLTTANFAPNNRILNWYVGGLNFQVEHHLFPNICHIHYKNISPIVAKTAQEFGIPYNIKPTLRSALKSHALRLKELGGHRI